MKTLLITLLLFFSSLVNAGVYKWTDEKGNVHYGDKPTVSSEQLNINVEKSISSSAETENDDETREERRLRISDAMTEDRLARKEAKAEAKNKKEQLNRRCVQSKDRLKSYKNAGRLYDLDKDGNRNILSDKSRDKAISNIQKEIRRNCN